jgi:hypothetical protein
MLQVAFSKACDLGIIDHYVPHRYYDYNLYFPGMLKTEEAKPEKASPLLGIILAARRKGINEVNEELDEKDIIIDSNTPVN